MLILSKKELGEVIVMDDFNDALNKTVGKINSFFLKAGNERGT